MEFGKDKEQEMISFLSLAGEDLNRRLFSPIIGFVAAKKRTRSALDPFEDI